MDKFNIFNLLTNLLSLNNKSDEGSKSDEKSNYSGGEQPKKAENYSDTDEGRAFLPPLQRDMISTMKTHDEIVRRVKAQNPPKK